MSCKGICEKYKVESKDNSNIRYLIGQKYCRGCEVFVAGDRLYCPCCNQKLRTKPAGKLPKEKLRKEKLRIAMEIKCP